MTVVSVKRGLNKVHFALQKEHVDGVVFVVDEVAMHYLSIATECLSLILKFDLYICGRTFTNSKHQLFSQKQSCFT